MKQVFKTFFGQQETRPIVVLICLVLSGAAEAASIGTLLPAVTLMSGDNSGGTSTVSRLVHDAFAAAGLTPNAGSLLLLVVALVLLKSLLAFAALSYSGVSAARVSIALRRKLIAAVFDARWSFFANESGGRIANVISNDAGRAGESYLFAAQVIAYSVQVVAYVVVAFLMNWRLAVVGILGAVLVTLTLGRLVKVSRGAGYKQTDRTAALTVLMLDMLANFKPLKSMERYRAVLSSITDHLKRLKRALVTRELSKAGLTQGSDAITAVLIGGGAFLSYHYWKIPLSELVVSGIVFYQLVSIASKLLKQVQQAAQLESAYVRTAELISSAEASREINNGKLEPGIGKGCRFEKVSFAHHGSNILDAVSFDIPSNAITVLSGRSGAGKTTLIDLLIGLYRPTSGKILVGHRLLDEVDLSAWRRSIGYVPQELSLFHVPVRDNITLGDETIPDSAVIEALDLAGASGFIASLPEGLDTDVGEMGGKLSGGQRQRISLARALVTRPEVLILDEVTSALDPETEAEIVSNIAALRGAYTIIAITHRPAWTAIADRLYKVSHGKVTLVKGKTAARASRRRKNPS